MFHGRYEHKVDAKGRVQVPIALRKSGEDSVYSKFTLVRGVGGCLALFSTSGFKKFEEAYMDGVPKKDVRFVRSFYSRMVEVELDSQGRILLPRLLREEVGIGDAVFFLGTGEWIEIWDVNRYEEYEKEGEGVYDDLASQFFETLGRKQPDRSENAGQE